MYYITNRCKCQRLIVKRKANLGSSREHPKSRGSHPPQIATKKDILKVCLFLCVSTTKSLKSPCFYMVEQQNDWF